MIRLRINDRAETLRVELRNWLRENPVPYKEGKDSLERFVLTGRAWQELLASNRWIGVHWPERYGGRGLSLVEEGVVQEELVRIGSPQLLGLFGLTMVGPVLIRHGTDRQRARFLPNILNAREIWCQGFSEPGAGSDLAAVKTKARETSDGYRLSGQKVWTSFAHIAQWCFVLCRTHEEGPRHAGLSYLLVPMNSPGITVRALKQISGDQEFNEVFFDDVLVPRENLVGEAGEGWKIAISTLMYERVVLTFARQLQSEGALRDLLQVTALPSGTSQRVGSAERPLLGGNLEGKLAQEIARAAAVRALAYRHLIAYGGGSTPGPEGSLDKLLWSESFQEITKLALQFYGLDAALSEVEGAAAPSVHNYLYSRGRTIAAGTSEIQRNIIAERLLGLPRSAAREGKG